MFRLLRAYLLRNVCASIGACHCQIMDWVIPGSVDMAKVKFDAQCKDDYRHNFSLLCDAFRNNSITRVSARCPMSDATKSFCFERSCKVFRPFLHLDGSSGESNNR